MLHLQSSIPIYDFNSVVSEPCADSDQLSLHLEKRRLQKQSYVRLAHVYEVSISMLHTYGYRRCRAYKFRLSHTSYKTLMSKLGMREEFYELTNTLYETADLRLTGLAMSQSHASIGNVIPQRSSERSVHSSLQSSRSRLDIYHQSHLPHLSYPAFNAATQLPYNPSYGTTVKPPYKDTLGTGISILIGGVFLYPGARDQGAKKSIRKAIHYCK